MLTGISIILLTYEQKEILKLQLEALSVQKSSPAFEVIITEDGSHSLNDKGILKNLKNSPFPIKYIWQQDIGERRSQARNNGIGAASGEMLIFLDGDMLPDENFVHNHIKHHRERKMIVAGNRIRRLFSSVNRRQNILEILGNMKLAEIAGETARHQINEEQKRRLYLKSSTPWRGCFSCNFSIANSPDVYFDENFVGWGPDDRGLFYRLTKDHGHKIIWDEGIIAYEMETGGKVGNVFLGNDHKDIVNYLRNVFYFYDRCSELTLEEAFWFMPRLRLRGNKWEVLSKSEPADGSTLPEMVEFARRWLQNDKR
jgi:glycosyltransferase involved in cell wall biosynthesis